jgi:competence protein ComEC
LRALGVRRLDLVVISHPHADHFAGLLEALDSVEVETFVDRTELADTPAYDGGARTVAGVSGPAGTTALQSGTYPAGQRAAWTSGEEGGEGEAGQYLELRARLAEEGCSLLLASSGSSLDVDAVHVAFFAPSQPLVLLDGADPWGEGRSPPSGDELNGGSLVTLLTAGQVDVLLPGDAEAGVLEGYHLPAAEALVVSHHGSRGAVSQSLLATLRPKLSLVSVGKGNTYGHPDGSTIANLEAAGGTIVRTDEYGWVCLRMEDTHMTVSTERTRVK